MSVLDVLLSRASVSPAHLVEPAPSGPVLARIFDAALRAPDHARLRPWRFLVIRGAARARLGDVFAAALQGRDPTVDAARLETERRRPQRAPLVVALVARLRPDHPVPEVEQMLSAGAAAMNLLNAAHALGYAGMWVTGANCYDAKVCAALGLADHERLIGFVHLGTRAQTAPPTPERPESSAHVREWVG